MAVKHFTIERNIFQSGRKQMIMTHPQNKNSSTEIAVNYHIVCVQTMFALSGYIYLKLPFSKLTICYFGVLNEVGACVKATNINKLTYRQKLKNECNKLSSVFWLMYFDSGITGIASSRNFCRRVATSKS